MKTGTRNKSYPWKILLCLIGRVFHTLVSPVGCRRGRWFAASKFPSVPISSREKITQENQCTGNPRDFSFSFPDYYFFFPTKSGILSCIQVLTWPLIWITAAQEKTAKQILVFGSRGKDNMKAYRKCLWILFPAEYIGQACPVCGLQAPCGTVQHGHLCPVWYTREPISKTLSWC